MSALAEDELVVVALVFQGGRHLPIRERPVAMHVVEIRRAVLEENANGLLVGLADQGGVVVAAADVGEAADEGENLPEEVRPQERKRERADPTARGDRGRRDP